MQHDMSVVNEYISLQDVSLINPEARGPLTLYSANKSNNILSKL